MATIFRKQLTEPGTKFGEGRGASAPVAELPSMSMKDAGMSLSKMVYSGCEVKWSGQDVNNRVKAVKCE